VELVGQYYKAEKTNSGIVISYLPLHLINFNCFYVWCINVTIFCKAGASPRDSRQNFVLIGLLTLQPGLV